MYVLLGVVFCLKTQSGFLWRVLQEIDEHSEQHQKQHVGVDIPFARCALICFQSQSEFRNLDPVEKHEGIAEHFGGFCVAVLAVEVQASVHDMRALGVADVQGLLHTRTHIGYRPWMVAAILQFPICRQGINAGLNLRIQSYMNMQQN